MTDDASDAPSAPPLTIAGVNAMVRESFPGSGSSCHELGDDFAVAGLETGPENVRPGGYVSGPTQFALADAALWYMSFVALGRIEQMSLTSELSIRFLRPAIGVQLRCRAVVESISRRSVVGTFHIWCDERPDKITATGQGTYALPL